MVRVTVGTNVGHKTPVVIVSVRGMFQRWIGKKVTNATAE
jgi:hypothetical protein